MPHATRITTVVALFAALSALAAPRPAHADMTMGKCFFFGEQPSSKVSIGGMTVLHNGSLTKTGTRGTQTIYKVDGGNVWVLYSTREQQAANVFLGGSVQTCDKNI